MSKKPSLRNNHLSFCSEDELKRDNKTTLKFKKIHSILSYYLLNKQLRFSNDASDKEKGEML